MAIKLTIKDCEMIIETMKSKKWDEFCLGCDLGFQEHFLEGGYCSCDNDE